jgi:serine/threonine-protein kinase
MQASANITEAPASGAELSDAELVALYRANGNDVAFSELVRRHQIPIFRLLLSLLGDADEAEKACEQTFVEAARKLETLKDPAAFQPWLAGLARALVKKTQAAQGKPKKKSGGPKKPPPRDPRGFVKQQVQGVLGELSNDERAALVLADLEGDSYESIAATLGTTPAAAEELVELARSKFVEGISRGSESAPSADSGPTAGAELEPGRVLGKRFRLEARLGEGGMGAVYRATDLETGSNVAVKTLLPEATKDPAMRRRFEREAKILQKLSHPNFVRFVDYGVGGSEPAYVAMELLDGNALSHVISDESRLGAERALHITRHVLTGLQYAHDLGVVHRDVKPDNVVLVQQERDPEFAKVLDFGIARLADTEAEQKTQLTQKGEIFGTPAYMAPEQVRGDPVDPRADLYSVSVMLYEMLASQPPFVAKNQMGLFAMHLATMPPPLSELVPEDAQLAALQPLLDVGLAKEPGERFASAADYLGRIDALIASGVTKGGNAVPRAPQLTNAPRNDRAARATAHGAGTTSPAARKSREISRKTLVLVFCGVLVVVLALGLGLVHFFR